MHQLQDSYTIAFQQKLCRYSEWVTRAIDFFFFFFFFFYHSFILHRLERRTRPIWTPYDGRRRWDSNLRTPACESPALPLCYGRRVLLPYRQCIFNVIMWHTQYSFQHSIILIFPKCIEFWNSLEIIYPCIVCIVLWNPRHHWVWWDVNSQPSDLWANQYPILPRSTARG